MKACGDALSCFILSFEVKEERAYYSRMMYAHWMVLKTDLSFCVEENIIHFKHRKPKSEAEAKTWTESDSVNSSKVEIFKLVASIDESIGKWFSSRKGKTVTT